MTKLLPESFCLTIFKAFMIQYSYKTDENQRQYAVGRQFIQDTDDILTMNLVLKTEICFSLHLLYAIFCC